jgi:hypothetical protein
MSEADIWTVVNSLTENGEDLRLRADEINLKKLFNSYMVNKALSNNVDTLFNANEMNRLYGLDWDMQYTYLYGSVKKKKRPFQKWFKAPGHKYLDAVMFYYDYSVKKALRVCSILTEDQLKIIQKKFDVTQSPKEKA